MFSSFLVTVYFSFWISFSYCAVNDTSHCITLRHIACWFDPHMNMITTIALSSTSIMSHNYHFFIVVRTFKIYFLSNCLVYNTVLLSIITKLCIRSQICFFLFKSVHLSVKQCPSLTSGGVQCTTTMTFRCNCPCFENTGQKPWRGASMEQKAC